ncbi:MAG: sodium:solute symporter family protein [Melioribacteraceae bacterium]|nr:sodium:solute symporter family protein [Melioribacteraceae bacterium]
MQNEFHWLDVIVIVGYFVGITAYGLWLTKKVKSSDGFFRGERKFKWWIMMGQAFGAGTHAENFVAQTGASFQLGFASIWYQWKNMIITPFYWLIAPWYRRSERTTVGEIVGDRYGNKMAVMYSAFAIMFFIMAQGVMLKGAAKVISVATGDMISSEGVVVGMTLAFIIYSFFGGLVASAYANFIQAIMIIVLSFMLIPSGLIEVGGYAGMRESLPENFFDIYNSDMGLGWFTILMLAVNGVIGITAQPHMVSMCATGNTERSGRVGQTYGSFVKRFATIGWAFTGLIVAALLIQDGLTLDDPEKAFGYATRELLWPGFTGLMIASVMAANMSSCSNFMVNTGALFTQNIYKEFINKAPNDKQLLMMGRYSSLALTSLGVVFAMYVSNVLHAFLFLETMAAFVGIMVFGGNLWRRANRHGGLASVLVSFIVYYTLNYLNTQEIDIVYNWNTEVFAWSMLAGFVSFIFVSLITKPEDKKMIDAYFNKMQLLSDDDAKDANGNKPLATERGMGLILLDGFPGWFKKDRWTHFAARYREDWTGFLLAWVFVVVLILFAWLILQL